MNDRFGDALFAFVMGMFVGIGFWCLISMVTDNTYKNGQIDALTGKVRYELVEHEDKTKSWEAIEINENK